MLAITFPTSDQCQHVFEMLLCVFMFVLVLGPMVYALIPSRKKDRDDKPNANTDHVVTAPSSKKRTDDDTYLPPITFIGG